MSDLTFEQITAAQNKDIAATSAVVAATESRVVVLAQTAARRMAPGGPRYMDYLDQFTQDGRVAVWESLSRFKGASVDDFFAFIYATVGAALLDSVRSERNPGAGADKAAMKVFGQMLEMADGDVFLAERFARTVPVKQVRLGADRAQAARLAWQGTSSLDAPDHRNQDHGGMSLGESLAGELGVPEELLTAADLNQEAKRVKHAVVHGILDVMGEGQRVVLKHSFGIDGATFYGRGLGGDDAGLAEEIGSTVPKVRDAREKGLKAFAKRYIVATAKNEDDAAMLTATAAKNLGRGGCK